VGSVFAAHTLQFIPKQSEEVGILNRENFLNSLVANHNDRIAILIKAMINSVRPQDVEDCVQEVYLAAIKNKNLENHPNIERWINITVRNIAWCFNKKQKSLRKILYIIDDDGVNFEVVCKDFANQVDEDIFFKDLTEQGTAEKILDSLTKIEYDFYKLKYNSRKKLSTKQIAEIMEKTEGAIRIFDMRLREKIKKIVRKYVTNEL
jgi:RNA polymerase sigma factor (sigma-70 family)